MLAEGWVIYIHDYGRGEGANRDQRPGLEMMTDYDEEDGNAAQREPGSVCLTTLQIAAFRSSLVQPSSPALKRVNSSLSALGWVPLLCYFFYTAPAFCVLALILVFCYS